jgi:hypothetical protein
VGTCATKSVPPLPPQKAEQRNVVPPGRCSPFGTNVRGRFFYLNLLPVWVVAQRVIKRNSSCFVFYTDDITYAACACATAAYKGALYNCAYDISQIMCTSLELTTAHQRNNDRCSRPGVLSTRPTPPPHPHPFLWSQRDVLSMT